MSYGLGLLENALDVCLTEEINGAYTLTFSIAATDPKVSDVVVENIIEAPGGQLFVIKEIQANHDDQALLNVSCEHIFYALLDEYIETIELEGDTPADALAAAINISGCEFTIGTVEPTTLADYIQLDDTNPIEVITEIISQCGGELYRDNFTIHLLNRRGSDTGVQFRYGKNIKSIARNVSTKDMITRLIPYGVDDIDIILVNPTGKKHIDSQYIDLYRRPKVGIVRWSEVEDENELLAKAQEYLPTVDIPAASYELDVVELKSLTEYGDLEEFALGDDITVVDEVLGIDVKVRITKYSEYPYEPWRSSVTLANVQADTSDLLASFTSTQKTVEKVTTPSGNLNTYWLSGVIDTLKNQVVASGAYATAQVVEGKGLLFENVQADSPDYGALYLGPGILAIADHKDGGVWDWRTFGKGSGFTADLVTAGTLKGVQMTIGADDSVFKASTSGIHLGNAGFAAAPFSVDMTGALKANSGTIGGWTIDGTNGLKLGLAGNTRGIATGDIAFYAGSSVPTIAPFRVSTAGVLTATGVNLTGTIDWATNSGYANSAGSAGSAGSAYISTTLITGASVESPIITGNAGNFLGSVTVGSGTNTAGISGTGSADTDVRFWAGATYANRATAPFRVTQGGLAKMTGDLTVNDSNGKPRMNIWADPTYGAAMWFLDTTYGAAQAGLGFSESPMGLYLTCYNTKIVLKKFGNIVIEADSNVEINDNVGIKTNPSFPLHVEGNTKLNGNVGIGVDPNANWPLLVNGWGWVPSLGGYYYKIWDSTGTYYNLLRTSSTGVLEKSSDGTNWTAV